MSQTQNIILYGGAFDPVHNGHLRIAHEAAASINADKVYFIPTGQPPHRDKAWLTAEQRLTLLNAATGGNELFEISDFEIQRAAEHQPSFTVETIRYFKQQNSTANISWLMGSDAFAEFDRWHQWQDILQQANLLIAERPGDKQYPAAINDILTQNQTGKIIPLAVTQLDISSSNIRQQLLQGQTPRYLVPDAVLSQLLDMSSSTKHDHDR